MDSSNLSEANSISELGPSRSILQDISCASSPNSRAAYDKAERAFIVLESQAEEALRNLINKLYPSTAPLNTTRIPISPQDLSSIIKFFVFLRFRNGPHYRQIVQELMEPMDLEVSTKGKTILAVYSPLIRQVRLQTVLRAFRKFFETPIWDMKPSADCPASIPPSKLLSFPFKANHKLSVRKDSCLDALNTHCWRYCHEAEICLGIAAEDDREFVLPECCFGVLDESFGGGIGAAKAP